MMIGFDIGNTSTTAGVYNSMPAPVQIFRFDTTKYMDARELTSIVTSGLEANVEGWERKGVSGLVFSSVVPEINPAYHDMASTRFAVKALEINHECKLSVKLNYHNPRQLGPDRIVNAEAAYREYGGDSIIVDIGTAATFCVLLSDGTFDGGLISPGVGTTISALSSQASRLPEILFQAPDRLVARDTENALKSGFFYGWISLVDGIIARIESEYQKKLQVIMTGGYSDVIAREMEHENIFDPLLPMKGLKYIFDLNG